MSPRPASAKASKPRVGLRYRLARAFIGRVARPTLGKPPAAGAADTAFYVLEKRSLSDLLVLDLMCEELELPSPLGTLTVGAGAEKRRFGFLDRTLPWYRPADDARRVSRRLKRLLEGAAGPVPGAEHPTANNSGGDGVPSAPLLIPVLVQWGRAPHREGSIWQLLLSEDWSVTSRLRRLLNLLFNRRDIVVTFGHPTALRPATGDAVAMLHRQLRDLRLEVVGPDFSHRRTLALEVATSTPVREALAAALADQAAAGGIKPGTRAHRRLVEKLQRRVRRHVDSIVSNMTYSTIMVLERLLRWFWNKIYNGVELRGVEALQQIPEGHQLIYVPSHRSHVDYLLLSYLLFKHGRVIPHIVAGDNLNLPVVGGILRRGGAFFMRRSFRDDPLYGAVFSEYLHLMYRRGHSVEFFPEGGRSRTGRLLPARLGLLKMTLDHHRRGLPRPVTLVPVYFGYEKLIEGKAYLDQLRGEKKKRESLGDVFRNLRLTRQNFGRVMVNIGRPIHLDTWVAAHRHEPIDERPEALGRTVMTAINSAAVLNPVNLIALVILATTRLAIERELLAEQIELYVQLLKQEPREHQFVLPQESGEQAIVEAAELGMLRLESADAGSIASCDPQQAVLLTWYRNNVAHCLSVAALIAALMFRRRRPLRRGALLRMVRTLHPFIADELSFQPARGSYERWLSRLLTAGLLEQDAGSQQLRAPAQGSSAWYQLKLLAQVVMQSLERMFIVIALLKQQQDSGIDRDTLKARSQTVARQLSRLYGLNAPEFFDGALFNQFIDALIDLGQVTRTADGRLVARETISDVIRNAWSVIDADMLQAVLRACGTMRAEERQEAA
ncbi:MAG: glycerol-3-phosphate 1-O-acyltransferase PlsB [Pseudomonadota bacterium]